MDAPAEHGGMQTIAVDCTNYPRAEVEAYVQAGIVLPRGEPISADVDHFRVWRGVSPTSDGQLAAYLAAHAETLSAAYAWQVSEPIVVDGIRGVGEISIMQSTATTGGDDSDEGDSDWVEEYKRSQQSRDRVSS